MRRKLLLAFLISTASILPAHAEWLIAECSAYTPYDCGTITATGETVHVGGVACNFLPFGTVVVIDGTEYVVNDRCGIDDCIDIFMESYEEAIQFGRQNKEVYVKR
nr:MAG TPA: 3D containing protein [Caudoviricetes sp.]